MILSPINNGQITLKIGEIYKLILKRTPEFGYPFRDGVNGEVITMFNNALLTLIDIKHDEIHSTYRFFFLHDNRKVIYAASVHLMQNYNFACNFEEII